MKHSALPRMYQIIQTMIDELGDDVTDAAVERAHGDVDFGGDEREILLQACTIILARRAELTKRAKNRYEPASDNVYAITAAR